MSKGKWKISLKSVISLRWHKHLPRLVIHEKYEKYVKWTLRALILIGIISSVIAFPVWYVALTFAIVLVIIGQFFEKAIFLYTTIYVQPMPDFEYEPEKWKGMAFAFPQDTKLLNVVGCAFSDREHAIKFFELLKNWNYGETKDMDNNICLSFIIESDEEYSVYIYPNLERRTIQEYFQEVEKIRKHEKYGKEHQQLVMQRIFWNRFPYGMNSQLKLFIQKQPKNRPFLLNPFIMKEDGQPEMIYNEISIVKYHFKFKNRHELKKNETEYQHRKK